MLFNEGLSKVSCKLPEKQVFKGKLALMSKIKLQR